MATLQELRTKRADLIERARSCQTRMEGENKRSIDQWLDAERDEYMALVSAADAVDKEFATANAATTSYNRLQEMAAAQDLPEPGRQRQNLILPGQDNGMIQWNMEKPRLRREWAKSATPKATPEYNKAFNAYLRGNEMMRSQLIRDQMAASVGMSTDNEERGGYFQTSEQFMTEIIKQVDDSVFVQALSRVIMMPPAKSLGARVRRQRASTFTWYGENADISGGVDSSLLYGKRLITPNYLSGSTIMSRDLLRNVPSSEAMVIEEIGVDLNYKLEPAFLTGSGNQQPMGLMTANTDGISTGRDFTSGATSFTFDDWTNLKYSLKNKYRSKATWMLHRFVLNQTALLKNGMGQYLWEPSRQLGFPDMILGLPVVETEWMPYVVTSGQYYALLGDFSWYWIVYEMGMEMQRLIELRAHTNEYEYLFRCKLDAQPMLEEAFSRGKRA